MVSLIFYLFMGDPLEKLEKELKLFHDFLSKGSLIILDHNSSEASPLYKDLLRVGTQRKDSPVCLEREFYPNAVSKPNFSGML